MLNFILRILAQVNSEVILVGVPHVAVRHTIAPAIGEPDNQVIQLEWTGEGQNWATKLTEEGVAGGSFVDEHQLFDLTDFEGSRVRIRVLLNGVVQAFKGGTTPKDTPLHVLVQEGGSSTEMYLHAHDTAEEADADRQRCWDDGAYRTSPAVEVPRSLADHPDFFEVVEKLLRASQRLGTGLEEA